jgi:hypothetical protein
MTETDVNQINEISVLLKLRMNNFIGIHAFSITHSNRWQTITDNSKQQIIGKMLLPNLLRSHKQYFNLLILILHNTSLLNNGVFSFSEQLSNLSARSRVAECSTHFTGNRVGMRIMFHLL